ncbi:lysophosphatidic acid receptor 2-like [Cottoperca gobio]|uniref:Lysophosphatidic acid receptor 2-like n=1 Tax=Cottoperca gobio TaxID=56716 RepID=A0A6J2PDI7_COTGO|nr:lysophosphatidic acid receptor 2-like [Cottoperca gobio]
MDTLTDDTEGCYYNRTVKFFYEKSGKNISMYWRSRDYVIVTLGMTVCFIVIFSNLLVMGAIIKNRRFHYPIYYLLGNLAVADLFSGVSYLHLMFHTGPWTIKLTKYRWFVRQGLIDTSLTASVLNLLAVAVERHQTIFNMQLHSKMSTRRVFVIIVFIWLVAIIMGLVPTMGWHCLCNLDNCSTMAPMYSRSYLVFWAVLNLLTFSIMVAVYTRIFVYVRHKSKQMSQHTTQMRHRETVFNLMKTVSMILAKNTDVIRRHEAAGSPVMMIFRLNDNAHKEESRTHQRAAKASETLHLSGQWHADPSPAERASLSDAPDRRLCFPPRLFSDPTSSRRFSTWTPDGRHGGMLLQRTVNSSR